MSRSPLNSNRIIHCLVSLSIFLHVFAVESEIAATVTATSSCNNLHKEVLGANSAFLRSSLSYANPVVEYYLSTRKFQVIRFPGGTPSSSHDWYTGRTTCYPGCNCTSHCQPPDPPTTNRGCHKWINSCPEDEIEGDICNEPRVNHNRVQNLISKSRRWGSLNVTELNKLMTSTSWQGSIVFVINVCDLNPQTSLKLAKYVDELYKTRSDGALASEHVLFELGNELYFDKYNYCAPDTNAYNKKARAHAKKIKTIDKNFRVAALMSSARWKQLQPFEQDYNSNPSAYKKIHKWNLEYSTDTFNLCYDFPAGAAPYYDAVTVHMYARTVVPDTPPVGLTVHQQMFNRYTDHVDMEFDASIAALSEKFKRPVWVTEWHMGQPSDASQEDIKIQYYGGLYRNFAFLYLLSNPNVTMSNFQALNDLIRVSDDNIPCDFAEDRIGPELTGTDEEKEADFRGRVEVTETAAMTLDAYGNIVEDCSKGQRIILPGVRTYVGEGSFDGTFSEVFAVLFHCSLEYRAVFVNKRNSSYQISMSGLADSENVQLQVVSYREDENNAFKYNKVLTSTTGSFSLLKYETVVVSFPRTTDYCSGMALTTEFLC